jgi:hypothetical protein
MEVLEHSGMTAMSGERLSKNCHFRENAILQFHTTIRIDSPLITGCLQGNVSMPFEELAA